MSGSEMEIDRFKMPKYLTQHAYYYILLLICKYSNLYYCEDKEIHYVF